MKLIECNILLGDMFGLAFVVKRNRVFCVLLFVTIKLEMGGQSWQ